MDSPEPYVAVALQTVCAAVNNCASAKESRPQMSQSADRIASEIAAARGWVRTFHDAPLRLAVLPEFVLTGFPMRESLEEWRERAALEPDSDVHQRLGRIAQDNDLFLCANLYERNELAPELYFQATIIFGPEGGVILRYLRMISISTPSPYDLWSRYVESVGLEQVFPVVETELGRLGVIASEEILFPEVARVLAFQGAEVLLHPTSEMASPSLTPKDIAKRARAIENAAYVVSANTAGISGTALPSSSADGMSKIIDPGGHVLADTAPGPSMNASAFIDITALRKRRARAAMSNLLPRVPAAAFWELYRDAKALPPDGLESKSGVDRGWLRERIAEVAAQLNAPTKKD